jgi:hypothetical protein
MGISEAIFYRCKQPGVDPQNMSRRSGMSREEPLPFPATGAGTPRSAKSPRHGCTMAITAPPCAACEEQGRAHRD